MNGLSRRITQTSRSIGQSAAELWRESTGATAIEYALIAALIVLVLIGGLVQIRESLINLPMQSIIDAFAAALP